MNVIDLFSGCGGLSYGFETAGFHILLGVDIWEDALFTFSKNHSKSKVLNGDLSQINPQSILNMINCKKENIDLIIGGPPCQGFSVSGKRDIDDPRNKLYKSFVKTVDFIRPKVFLMENVPGLIRLFNGQAKEEILSDFDKIGYNVSFKILNASNYGVPQDRKRVFFVGLNRNCFDSNEFFDFPKPTHGEEGQDEYITCKNAIDDLPLLNDNISGEEGVSYPIVSQNSYQTLMRKNSKFIYNHTATIHKEQTREIIAMVPDGGNYKNLPQKLWKTRKVNIAWTRMNSKKPCFTIDTGHNHHFHYLA